MAVKYQLFFALYLVIRKVGEREFVEIDRRLQPFFLGPKTFFSPWCKRLTRAAAKSLKKLVSFETLRRTVAEIFTSIFLRIGF